MERALNTWVPLQSHDLECPVCRQRLEVLILVDLEATYARISSRTSFSGSVSVDGEAKPRKVKINHSCEIKEGS